MSDHEPLADVIPIHRADPEDQLYLEAEVVLKALAALEYVEERPELIDLPEPFMELLGATERLRRSYDPQRPEE